MASDEAITIPDWDEVPPLAVMRATEIIQAFVDQDSELLATLLVDVVQADPQAADGAMQVVLGVTMVALHAIGDAANLRGVTDSDYRETMTRWMLSRLPARDGSDG